MKFISPIQSFSDIITNSSSEVFLMDKEDADYFDSMNNGCIDVIPINNSMDVMRYFYYSGLFCDYFGKNWDEIINDESSLEKLKGLYIVDIEDHFANCEEVYDEARDRSIASYYSH